jgi:hypothetical protein
LFPSENRVSALTQVNEKLAKYNIMRWLTDWRRIVRL